MQEIKVTPEYLNSKGFNDPLYSSNFEKVLKNGEFPSNLINITTAESLTIAKSFTSNRGSSNNLSQRTCNLSSVQNCIVQTTYFFHGLIQLSQKIEFKGVVFQNSNLYRKDLKDPSVIPVIFKIGYVFNNQLRKNITIHDLLNGIGHILECTSYFKNKNLNDILVEFKQDFGAAKKQTSIDKILRTLENSKLFKKKSKLVTLSHFSTMGAFLRMKQPERQKLINLGVKHLVVEQVVEYASKEQERQAHSKNQKAILLNFTDNSEEFFKILGFEPVELNPSSKGPPTQILQKKWKLTPKRPRFYYDKTRPKLEQQCQINNYFDVEFYETEIQIRFKTSIQAMPDIQDTLLDLSNRLDLGELNLNVSIQTIENQKEQGKKYICFKTTLSSCVLDSNGLRFGLMVALDALLVIGMVFQSDPHGLFEVDSAQILQKIYHYMEMVKNLSSVLYSLNMS